MSDNRNSNNNPNAHDSELLRPSRSDLMGRLERSQRARKSLSDAIDFLQRKERKIQAAGQRLCDMIDTAKDAPVGEWPTDDEITEAVESWRELFTNMELTNESK